VYAGRMSTLLVFLMTLGQLVAVGVGRFVPIPELYDAFVHYGSPTYFIMNLLGNDSVMFEDYPFFPMLAAFHVIKYVCLCRSQFVEARFSLHYLAVIFEIIYLVICFLA
jgi:hypothetical protein